MKRKVFMLCLLSIVILLILSGTAHIGRIKDREDYECSIWFPCEVVNISGNSPSGFAEDLVEASDGRAVYEVHDNDSVTIYMDEETRVRLIENCKKLMDELAVRFESEGDNYYVSFSEDYTMIRIAYDLKLSPVKAIDYVMYADLLCASSQILTDNNGASWNILIIIEDSGSGREITRGFTRDGSITYTFKDWQEP